MRFSYYLIAYLWCSWLASCQKQGTNGAATTTFYIYRDHGLDVGWDHSVSNRIAYSMKGSAGRLVRSCFL